jgi:hypothetical protein
MQASTPAARARQSPHERVGSPRAPGLAWALAAGVLLAVFLWVLAPVARGEAAPLWDADGFFVPYYTLVSDFARAGRLLVWNPWTSAGSPDWIEPNVGALSPTTVLSAALTGGGQRGYRIHWLALWFVAALGILVWARRLGVPPVAGIAVALGFAFSGPFTGNAEHLSFLQTLAFMPFVLERVEEALASGRLLVAAQAGALWGLSGLGGYPGLFLAFAGLIGLWMTAPTRRLPVRRRVSVLLVTGTVAALVLLPSVLPLLLEGPGFTDRAHPLARDVATGSNALGPMALVTAASPALAALPPARYWPATDVSSASIYSGGLTLFLAVYALAARPRDAWRWWLLGCAGVYLALALGSALPLRGWLYDLVPPTRYFRHASLFRLPAVLALVLLALYGAADLFAATAPAGRRRMVASVAGVALALAGLATYHLVLGGTGAAAIGSLHSRVVWSGVGVLAVLSSLPRSRARTRVLLALVGVVAVADAHGTFAVATTVATPALVEPWRQLEAARVRTLDLLSTGDLSRLPVSDDSTGLGPGPTNKNLLLRRPALVGYAPMTTALLGRWAATPALAAPVIGADRVFFAPLTVRADPGREAFERFAGAVAASGRMPLVVHDRDRMALLNRDDAAADPGLPEALARAPAAEPLAARWQRYDADALRFAIDAPGDGWLLVADRWARGWRAAVDGTPTPVQGGNFLFRALPVTEGSHVVEMWYRPAGLWWVLLASWGTLAAVFTATVLAGARGARRAPDSGGRYPAG